MATQNGHLEIVKYLDWKYTANVNIATNDKITPLHIACREGHLKLGKYLLTEARANRLLKGKNGAMDIHFATSRGQLDIVKCLVEEQSADVNVASNSGITPLHMACYNHSHSQNMIFALIILQILPRTSHAHSNIDTVHRSHVSTLFSFETTV